MMRKTVIGTIVAVTAPVDPTAAQAAPYCGISWGSTGKNGTGTAQPGVGPVINVRAGQHDCYDRLVIDFNGGAGGYHVQYVLGVPHQALDGNLPLRAGAFLNDVLRAASYDISSGAATYSPADQASWSALRDGRQCGRCRGAAASRDTPRSESACAPGCRSGRSLCPAPAPSHAW